MGWMVLAAESPNSTGLRHPKNYVCMGETERKGGGENENTGDKVHEIDKITEPWVPVSKAVLPSQNKHNRRAYVCETANINACTCSRHIHVDYLLSTLSMSTYSLE
jgi:hypothetical protein